MGKPIAGRGQRPFNISGILVNGAKINGDIFIKNIYMYKQRSYNVYDLIDELGQVHEYVTFVYRNEDGNLLKYTDLDADITASLADNTFYIKEQDPHRGIYGFSTLYQYNKIKINTGDYIFRDSEEFDYSLLAVQVMPYTVVLNVGDIKTFNIRSVPHDYQNLAGFWNIDNECISPVSNNRTPEFTIKAETVGDTIISFTPAANETLTSFAHIKILEKPVDIEYLNIVYPEGGSTDRGYSIGESFTLRFITEPLNARPNLPYPDKMDYDSEYLELTNVSSDNKYFTFKVISDRDAGPYNRYGGIQKSVVFTHTIDDVVYKTYSSSNVGFFHIVTKSTDVIFKITGEKRYVLNSGSGKLFANYDPNVYILDPNEPVTWEIEGDDGTDGSLNIISKLECEYTAPPYPNAWRHVGVNYKGKYFYMTVWFSNETYANSVRIAPFDINTMKPGDSVQLTPVFDPVDYVPQQAPVFNYGVWGDIYPDFFDLTPDGLLTVKQEISRNIELRPNMFLPNVMFGVNEFKKYIALTIEDVKPTYMSVRQLDGQYVLPLGQDIVLSVTQSPTVNSYVKISYEWDDPTFVEEDVASNAYQLSNDYSSLNNGAILRFKPLKIGTHKITLWFDAFPDKKYYRTITVFQPG